MWFTRFSPGCNSENWHEDRTGLAGSSLAVLGVTQSVAMAHTSVITNTYSPRCFLRRGYSTNSISPSPHSQGFWCVLQQNSALGGWGCLRLDLS